MTERKLAPGRGGAAGLALALLIVFGTIGAVWMKPPPAHHLAAPQQGSTGPAPGMHRQSALGSTEPAAGRRRDRVEGRAGRAPQGAVGKPAIEVAQWDLRSAGGADVTASGHAPAGRPLILRMKLAGSAAAVERIRRRGGIPILVHWTRVGGKGSADAPDLVTRLSVGNPRVAGALAGEVRHQGFFEWHAWAEKGNLTPGTWSLSLTGPNGRPLACGTPPRPCRFALTVG